MFTPGPVMSGLSASNVDGPRELNEAITSPWTASATALTGIETLAVPVALSTFT